MTKNTEHTINKLPNHTEESNQLLSQDDGTVAGNVFTWVLEGRVGLDDIKRVMTEELDNAEDTQNPEASVGAFYMKWQNFVQSMAQVMLESDYFTRPKRNALSRYTYDSCPILKKTILESHNASGIDSNTFSQDDKDFLQGTEQRLFHILTNDGLYQDNGDKLISHLENASHAINPNSTEVAGTASKAVVLH